MQRVKSVSDETRNSVSQDADEKEIPAEAAAGLSTMTDKAELTMSGEDFVAAIRVILQARSVAENVIDYARIVGDGRPFDDFDDHELKYAKRFLIEAEIIYREMHRGQVRVDFKKIIGVKKFDFEDAVLTLQRFFGAAE